MVPEKQCQANIIFVILVHFLPFYHLPPPPSPNPKNPKDQNFEEKKTKKKRNNAWRYYPFVHTCVP